MDAKPQSTNPAHAHSGRPGRTHSHSELVWEHRLLWLLLFAILGLWGYHYAMGRVDRQLRGEVLKILALKFPKHRVQLDRAHLEKGQAILLEGLQIALPTAEGLRDVVRIQRLVASGDVGVLDLLKKDIPIDHVRVEGIELSLWPVGDSTWSLQTLSNGGALPSRLPTIDVRNGLLRIGGLSARDQEFICHDLQAKGQLVTQPGLTSAPMAVPISQQSPTSTNPQSLNWTLRVASSFFRQIEVTGSLDPSNASWQLRGNIQDLDLSDRLLPLVPESLRQQAEVLRGVACRSSAQFEVQQGSQGLRYDVRGKILQGRVEHPLLPFLMESLQGDFYCRNGLLQLRQVHATHGEAKWSVDADIQSPETQPKLFAKTKIQDLNLNPRLFQAMPVAARNAWTKLQLSGTIDAEVEVTYQDGKWDPQAVVQCRNVGLVPDVFPYPVQQLQGEIHYRAGVIHGEGLRAMAGGQPLAGSISLERWNDRWLIDLQVASEGNVSIDPELIAALTVRNQPTSNLEKFVQSLKPSGLVALKKARFRRTRESPDYLSKSLELQFFSASIHYNNFRYPIFDIQGQVVVADDVILLQDFEGRHDSARIACHGRYVQGQGGGELSLNFLAHAVPFQEGLRRALPPQVQQLWDQAQPSGVLDQVKVLVTRSPSNPALDVRVDIEENGPIDSQTAQTVSLRPPAMPYLLNDISCLLSYRPGVLDIKLKGYHDSSVVITEGNCRLQDDGSWKCWLSWLPETRVLVDRSLLAALPPNLRKPLETVDFRGPVNVGGWTLFVADPRRGSPYAQSYDLSLDIEEGRLSSGRTASGIRGSIAVQGLFSDSRPLAVGHFQLDSMAVKDIPISNLRGRFAMDGENFYFGRDAKKIELPSQVVTAIHSGPSLYRREFEAVQPASSSDAFPTIDRGFNRLSSDHVEQSLQPIRAELRAMDADPDDLQARLLSGQLRLHGSVQLQTGRVHCRMQLTDADFRSLLLDLNQEGGKASGILSAELEISGSPHNLDTLSGDGVIRLRDADLYELPSMIKLFNILRVRPPDSGAFETADVRFRVDGDRFPLDEFALDGDLISLRGSGWVNMRRELSLNLDTYVGRRGQLAQMIGPILSKNDSATLLHIEVFGTTDNPQMRRSFPGLETRFDQIFPERSEKR